MNLLKTINEVVRKEDHDTATKREMQKAQDLNKRANIVNIGQIQFRAITSSGNVGTQVAQPLGQQRAANLIEELGVKYLDGLSANFVYPIMDGNTSYWVDETEQVTESNTSFNAISLQPKRLSTYVEYSRDIILNPSTNVAEAIQNDVINSIYEKVQDTLLNDVYDSANTTSISAYSDVVDFEYAAKNINNPIYVVSPLAAKKLKTMKNGDTPIFQNGMIDGISVYITPSLSGERIILGDFSRLLLAQWGSLDVTIDDVTKAKNGIIRLIVNSYWNYGKIDDNAFVYGTTETE